MPKRGRGLGLGIRAADITCRRRRWGDAMMTPDTLTSVKAEEGEGEEGKKEKLETEFTCSKNAHASCKR